MLPDSAYEIPEIAEPLPSPGYIRFAQRCPDCGHAGYLHRRRRDARDEPDHCIGVPGAQPGQPVRADDPPCPCVHIVD